MPPENNPSGAQPGETHVISPDAPGNVPSGTPALPVTPSNDISLSDLNKMLGKNFPDKETALKSIVDTASYVGRKKEDIEKEVLARVQTTQETDKLAKEIEAMRKDNFFRDNPQYATPEVRTLIERFGGNPSEVVAQNDFKSIFEKVKGYEESQNLRTVLDSNPRLASSRDTLEKAKEAINNSGGYRTEAVENSIADAILNLGKK